MSTLHEMREKESEQTQELFLGVRNSGQHPMNEWNAEFR